MHCWKQQTVAFQCKTISSDVEFLCLYLLISQICCFFFSFRCFVFVYILVYFQLFWLLSVWMDWIWFTFFVLLQFQRVIFQANKTYNKKNTLSHTSKAKASSWRPRELIIRIKEWLSQLFSIAFRRIVIETGREKKTVTRNTKELVKVSFIH